MKIWEQERRVEENKNPRQQTREDARFWGMNLNPWKPARPACCQPTLPRKLEGWMKVVDELNWLIGDARRASLGSSKLDDLLPDPCS
jgi:hypothetical protein